jgi:elongation factor Ts
VRSIHSSMAAATMAATTTVLLYLILHLTLCSLLVTRTHSFHAGGVAFFDARPRIAPIHRRLKMSVSNGEVDSSLIKTLRERTGAGFSTCKTALLECGGDINAAIDYMRKKGTAIALKKGVRTTSHGLIGAAVSDDFKRGAIVEINSETDFVARNEIFLSLVSSVASTIARDHADRDKVTPEWVSQLLVSKDDGPPESVNDKIVQAISTVGENIVLRRPALISVDSGVVASYMHNSFRECTGKIGVILGLQCKDSSNLERLRSIAQSLCLHIAAQNPEVISPEQVSPEALER